MLDSNDLLNSIKKAAVEAVDASKPTSLVFGTVTSASPLKINVEQKMTLTTAQLVLTRNVTNFKTAISGGNIQNFYYVGTEPNVTTEPVSPSHVHAVGKIQVTVHNALTVGDEVVLVRVQGGQKYIVLDRVVKA